MLNEDYIIEKIEYLRDEILLHSYLYYEKDISIISDYEYDMMCQELVILQDTHPEIAKECAWHEYFYDFDGSTGCHLPKNLGFIIRLAEERLDGIE